MLIFTERVSYYIIFPMNLIDWLSLILPVLAFACVLLIVIVNIYTKIWPKRFVHVNCWFCNEWSKVLTEYENSWDCVFCEQYNGFTNDGDYNKPILAQYNEKLNKVINSSLKLNTTPTKIDNGLCNICNNNQRLKVHQLAMFCPLNENRFEEEVEQFEKQLEHVYKLCEHCQDVVKQTLQKQKSILLSQRLKTIRQQGLDYLNFNKSHQGISKTVKKNFFLTAVRYTTIALAFIRIFEVLKICDFTDKKVGIATLLPDVITQYISLVKDLILICSNSFCAVTQNIWDLHEILLQNYLTTVFELVKTVMNFINTIVPHGYILYLLNLKRSFIQIFIGTFLQIVYCVFDTRRRLLDFTKCIIWGFLLYNCIGKLELSTENQSMRNMVEIVVCCFLIFPSNISAESQNAKKSTVDKPSNVSKNLENCDNEQFVKYPEAVKETREELNDSFVSTSTSLFQKSSPTMKLFSMAGHDSINLFPTFGQHPVFDNPLNSAPSLFKCSEKYRSNLSTHENETESVTNNHQSFYSDQFSLNDTFSSTSTLLNSEVLKPNEMELNSGLSNLHLSAFFRDKPLNNCEMPSAFHVNSMALRPKPVLSPPRLRNVTQSSWVAGGYWKSNEYLNNFSGLTNLSRSSSQSSGFGSQSSGQPHSNFYDGNNVFNSLPSSKTNSVCGDFDKFSVLSEPAYQYNSISNYKNNNNNNRFYPVLRPDNQLHISPPYNNRFTNSRIINKSPVQIVNNNNSLSDSFSTCFAYPTTNRLSSRESQNLSNLNLSHSTLNSYSPFSTCSNFSARSSGNPFYSHAIKRVDTPRPFVNSSPLSKGSLLQKWRENLNNQTNVK